MLSTLVLTALVPRAIPTPSLFQSLAKGSKVLPISLATSFSCYCYCSSCGHGLAHQFRREGGAFCRATAILTPRCLGLNACPGSRCSVSLQRAFLACSESVVPN